MDTSDSIGATPLPPQPLCKRHLDDETRVRFTPIKASSAPRIWDRKPSTSFLPRSKSRKVWKRFRSSFNSMKALRQLMAVESGGIKESDLFLEINTSRNTEYSRGVKRRCLALQREVAGEDESSGVVVEPAATGRGRSFLETKWESEVSQKRRKLPAGPYNTLVSDANEPVATDEMQFDENREEENFDNWDVPDAPTSIVFASVVQQDSQEAKDESSMLTPEGPATEAAYPDTLPGEPGHLPNTACGVISNIKTLEHVNQTEIQELASTICGTTGATGATDNASLDVAMPDLGQMQKQGVAPVSTTEDQCTMTNPQLQQLTTEQESTLVRSALRSSLGGEDTELLNNFLSKAKAKREAKAAAEAQASAAMIAQDPEESIQPETQVEFVVEIPTPDARRALENLDTNSPSPQKSPTKSVDEKGENAGDEGSIPVSPVGRRSTRARTSKPLQRVTAPASVRSTFSLRRARGTEFVFLQRTEAQELALLTRRNTRQNKGDAMLPKYTLQGLSRRTPETNPGGTPSDGESHHRMKKNNGDKPKKIVCWNDEQLVQFEGSESGEETANQEGKATTNNPEKRKAASGRSSRSKTSSKTGGDKAAAAATTATSAAASRGRRVRRLGPSKVDATIITTASDSDNPSASPQSPSSTASPIAKRKTLTPKSPKTMLMRTPSKTSSTGPSDDKPSLLSGGRSVKTNLLKVNAGSTPMPRRVRSRS